MAPERAEGGRYMTEEQWRVHMLAHMEYISNRLRMLTLTTIIFVPAILGAAFGIVWAVSQ